MRFKPLLSLVCAAASFAALPVHAELMTFEFGGAMSGTTSLFNAGDRFAGSYTFETTAPFVPIADTSLEGQSTAISPDLPGTGWQLSVFSSARAAFAMDGGLGSLAVGNQAPFGDDRYIVTLYATAGGTPPPEGVFQFLQIDLFDPDADMLSADGIAAVPNLALAASAGGRFFIQGAGGNCEQCQITIDALAPVPEAPPFALLAAGLSLLLVARRRREFISTN